MVQLWNTATGSVVQTFEADITGSWITEIALSSDTKLVALASSDGTVWLWKREIGYRMVLRTPRDSGTVYNAIAFSSDGKLLASTSGSSVQFWDTITGLNVRTIGGYMRKIRAIALSPNGKLLASVGWDGPIRLWDVVIGDSEAIPRSEGHTGKVLFWDTTTGNSRVMQTPEGFASYFTAVAFSPDGELLASVSDSRDRNIRIWDFAMARGEARVVRILKNTLPVMKLCFSSDSTLLAFVSEDFEVQVWDVAAGSVLHSSCVHPKTFNYRSSYFQVNADKELVFISRSRRDIVVNYGWIVRDGKDQILLSPDYLAKSWAIQGNLLAMGHESGSVTVLSIAA
ncbi:hypothetical protein TWF481_010334 [Arthrobotrys musiformis]|uniref:WD40 repeat-like protein n=1 Tax=Arthrobotrys musiformis TaxID=47236 RepID=A0AAV9W6G5_9PEZI